MFIYTGVMRGAGDTLIPMFITLFSLWIIRIPAAVFLSRETIHFLGLTIKGAGLGAEGDPGGPFLPDGDSEWYYP